MFYFSAPHLCDLLVLSSFKIISNITRPSFLKRPDKPHVRIKILPEILSNKIAAGEVVERPASVVKELVENAIDANSTKITVEIGQGGRSLIRVSDNGCGMTHDEALLAIERYATSKIFTDHDLYAISTLGFRGEALPSIASVSKFSLITKDTAAVSGTRIDIEGGKIKNVSDAGAPDGTMISVSQLFQYPGPQKIPENR
ncbi:MAG: DNA mismatch repair endonuclease MutL [Desulfobacterales bacterium]